MATEGDKLFQQATKKSQSSGGWFSSSSSKHEAAADLYQQSANAYKAESNFNGAGTAFSREAEERIKQGDAQHEAVQAWVNAGRCFKKTDPMKAVEVLGRAVTGLVKQGQFRQAADREKEVSWMMIQGFGVGAVRFLIRARTASSECSDVHDGVATKDAGLTEDASDMAHVSL
jgi:alpha-soluble NSF attachment protein